MHKIFYRIALLSLIAISPTFALASFSKSTYKENFLIGEVGALWCQREGAYGKGLLNREKIRRCIRMGSPIVLKTAGNQSWVVSFRQPSIRKQLVSLAGKKAMIHGYPVNVDGATQWEITAIEQLK